MGEPRQAWSSQEPGPAPTVPPHAGAPVTGGPGVPLQRGLPATPAFLFGAFVFQGQGQSDPGGGGKAAPSPWQLRRRPLGSRCASKGICMKTGTPFAERTGSGVHDALQRPRSCAPLPEQRRQPRAGEDLPTARPPHTASGPRTPPPAARGKGRLDQRFCRLITLFTEAWVEAEPRDPDLAARGRRKEPDGGGSGSQVPAFSSAARDPTPHLFSVGCMNVTSPISPRKAAPPWGARPAHRRGSVNDASVAPFQRFPSVTPLFGIPLSSHWRQDKLSGKSRGSRTRETWIQILPLHLSAV